jgi:hypothetical protein
MTAKKNLKRIIRQRMLRTGESYMAARRHFLDSKDLQMTKRTNRQESPLEELPIGQLQLTLETTRILKTRGIESVKDLIDAQSKPNRLRLDPRRAIEVREVLASRGL